MNLCSNALRPNRSRFPLIRLAVFLLVLALPERGQGAGTTDTPIERFMRQAQRNFAMQRTSSGLLYRLEKPGAGSRPRRKDTVIISCTALLPDGKTVIPQLSPRNLRKGMTDLLPGLTEGLGLVALGSRSLFILPPELSFSDGEWPDGLQPGTPLLFRVELEDIVVSGTAP